MYRPVYKVSVARVHTWVSRWCGWVVLDSLNWLVALLVLKVVLSPGVGRVAWVLLWVPWGFLGLPCARWGLLWVPRGGVASAVVGLLSIPWLVQPNASFVAQISYGKGWSRNSKYQKQPSPKVAAAVGDKAHPPCLPWPR